MIEVVREWSEAIKTGGLVGALVVLALVIVYLERRRIANDLAAAAVLAARDAKIADLQEARVSFAIDTARQTGQTTASVVEALASVQRTLERRRT